MLSINQKITSEVHPRRHNFSQGNQFVNNYGTILIFTFGRRFYFVNIEILMHSWPIMSTQAKISCP